MQKLPVVDENGTLQFIQDYPGDEQPGILVIDRKFYARDPAGFYRSAVAYVVTKQIEFSKEGIERKI